MRSFAFAAAALLVVGCATPLPPVTPSGVTADVTCEPTRYENKKFPRIAIAGQTVYIQTALELGIYRFQMERNGGSLDYYWLTNPTSRSNLTIKADGSGLLMSDDPAVRDRLSRSELFLYYQSREYTHFDCKGLAK